MKYWLLTTEYPPFFGGGIGTYCAVTARMLADKGHEVSVFVSDATVRDIEVDNKDGVRIIRFNTSRTKSFQFLGHVTNISYEFAHIVKHFIEKGDKPDCIEAQEYLGIAYYLLQYKKLLYEWCRHIPVLITIHSPSFLYLEYNHAPVYRYPNYWICEMERFCLQAADQLVSPSAYILKELQNHFTLHNKNVAVIPNPFIIRNSVADDHLNSTIPNEIVFFGKLSVQKGTFKLLKYFSASWDAGFSRPLYLVGGQDIVYHPEGLVMGDIVRKKYKKYIDAGLLKLEDRISPANMGQRLSKAEVVIIPSMHDNLPYVVLEMMALGKIVLVSKQGGQAEIVEDGVDGFIFDHERPESFSDQLRRILTLTPVERKEIVRNAAGKIAANYNPDRIFDQKIVLMEALLKSGDDQQIFPFIRIRSAVASSIVSTPFSKGKISIVIPFYNMGAYIEETVKSIQNSLYGDREIIIVNDGSTDDTSIRQLDQYRNNHQIKVIDISNGGLGNARNVGAKAASGEFLAFLDADDTIRQDYYSKAIGVLSQYTNVHFVGCWVQYFEDSGKTWPTFMPEPPVILYHNLVNSSGLVYKRNSFLTAGINQTDMIFQGFEDYESVIAMLAAGLGGVVLPETLFNYRVRRDSMVRELSRDKRLFLYKYINTRHKAFYVNFAADLLNLANANGPGFAIDNPSADHHLADNIPFGGRFSVRVISLVKKNRFAKTIAYKIYKLLKK